MTAKLFSGAIEASEQTQNSLRGLAGVARYAGEDIGASMEAAAGLTEDGLIDIASASKSLQNLLSRGFGLDESVEMLERLKDAAAFNRQGHLSMAEAVQSATEGIKNERSILVDNAGVTKNVSQMWKEYAAQINKGVAELTLAEKRQAEYNGILRETEGQTGNAKLAAEGLTGEQARLRAEIFRLQLALGNSLTPAFLELAKTANWVMQNAIIPFIGGIEIMATKAAAFWEKMKLKKELFDMQSMQAQITVSPMGLDAGTYAVDYTADIAALEARLKDLDQTAEEQISSIVKKWSGAIEAPNIGADTGKRRTDAPIDTDAGGTASASRASSATANADKELRALQRALDAYQSYREAVSAQGLASSQGMLDTELAQLEQQHAASLVSERAYVTRKNALHAAAEQERIALLTASAEQASRAVEAAAKSVSVDVSTGVASGDADAVTAYYKALTEETRKRTDLEKAAAEYRTAEVVRSTSLSGVDRTQLSAVEDIEAQLRTEEQKIKDSYQAREDMLRQALDDGIIQNERYTAIVTGLHEKMGQDLKDLADKTFNEQLGDAVAGWARNMSSTLNDILWQSDTTFSDILTSFGKMITEIIIQLTLVEPLIAAMKTGMKGGSWGDILGAFTGSEHGNAFAAGNVIPMAKGGIVNAPVIFPMASGLGLMGEAGPEAVLPLARTGTGDLGVKVASDGSSGQARGEATGGLRIINVLDPSVVGNYLSTAAGERMIVNYMQRNKKVLQ
jgi:hypothetical protein